MADRPIIMTGPMVRAILDGRKTQTRRVLTPQPIKPALYGGTWFDEARERHAGHMDGERPITPYERGMRLWVRETWHQDRRGGAVYRADAESLARWRSPIHMPRRLSRITLHVTDVRVQRVQEISEADARAEGVLYVPGHGDITLSDLRADPGYSNFLNCRQGFELLWGDLNGKRGFGWEQNPWVVAITFRPEMANIDAAKAAS